ncbi:hypothetical protein B9Z55_025465 [Caenorhabditis nigoni]|uniref:Uncharacterized protein n=1 Tax=Caenorhabditis nigoni TaxID=1611254 RepID=A0A2G5SZ23_9PELO|nr:hypothetical protein B9Z55_025465 [Caenorhabditis nigoni]
MLPFLPLPSLLGSLTIEETTKEQCEMDSFRCHLHLELLSSTMDPSKRNRFVSTKRSNRAHQPAPMPMDLEHPINQKNGVTNQLPSDSSQGSLAPTQLLSQNQQAEQKECERSKCQRLEKELKTLRKERNDYKKKLAVEKKKLEVEKKKMEFWHAKREKLKKEREDLKGEGYSVDVSPPLTPAGSVKE